ncbi:MAG: GH25 family lysozyme [Coprococcus sp.]
MELTSATGKVGSILRVVPCDFVVITTTEGTGYVNPDYERPTVRRENSRGNALGIYHYASVEIYRREAEYFLKK